MYKLYQMQDSGNCYKIRLLLAHLDIEYELIDVDILKGESRTVEFLDKNENGRVPVLEIDDTTFLPESNAILWYLAEGTDLVPTSRIDRAKILQWMFFEQYSHEPYIATSRYWLHILEDPLTYRDQLEQKRSGGLAALQVMNSHLESRSFFVKECYSIADISLYAYTHVADQGGFDLSRYSHILDWTEQVKEIQGHVDMSYRVDNE